MKSKTRALLSGIAMLTLVAVPIRPAAQEQRQQAEGAAHPDTGANPVLALALPTVMDNAVRQGNGDRKRSPYRLVVGDGKP